MIDSKNCKNCGTELTGAYCHACGQRDMPSGITLKQTAQDFLSYNFGVDGPALLTLKLLVVNPGKLVREFIHGKRKAYYKPVQFFIVSSLIYITVRQFSGYDPLENVFQENDDGSFAEFVERSNLAAEFMVKNINNLLLLLVISTAALLKLFHWKRQTFAEFLVLSFYVNAVYVFIGLIDILLSIVDVRLGSWKFLEFMAYLSYVYISFLGGFTLSRLLNSILIGVFSVLIYGVLGFGMSYLIVSIRLAN